MSTQADLITRIDALLPQTQCRQCGYAGCRPYAEAMASGKADINQCPPGGAEVARDLAALLRVGYKPVDKHFGVTKPPAVARIDEAICIGCTLCIDACPVDAIAGAAKLMHTVIGSECTGCELCLPPCPVVCIAMVETGTTRTREECWLAADRARRRFESRTARLRRKARTKSSPSAESRHATVRRAITRAKARLAARKQSR